VGAAAWAAAQKDVDPVLQNYGKLLEDGDLADVVFVVEGQRFPAYRGMLAAQGEYFRELFKSGMQDGGTKKVCYEDVSAFAFRVLLRFLYTGELPAWGGEARGEGGGGASGWRGEKAAGCGRQGRQKGGGRQSRGQMGQRQGGRPRGRSTRESGAAATAGGGPVPGGGAV
jgi:hypothetical protein